jgi:hypothetical protein
MKNEPEWIDVVALFAMQALLQTASKNPPIEGIAYRSYEMAKAMMSVKPEFTSEGDSDD